MPRRHDFYEPLIEDPGQEPVMVETPPIRGLPVSVAGTYLLTGDVTAWLRRYAETIHVQEARQAVLDAAALLDGAEQASADPDDDLQPPAPDEPPAPPAAAQPPVPAEPPPGIARVELFPNEDASYWYARAVDSDGVILPGPFVEGISQPLVEQQAAARWPGVPVYWLPDGMGDSFWDEQVASFGWNGRRRPSPRRMFANNT